MIGADLRKNEDPAKFVILVPVKSLGKLSDQDVISIGPWCKTEEAHAGTISVDTYPFRSCDQFRDLFLRVNDLYSQYLPQLARTLNVLNNCRHSLEFWEIYLGIFLRRYLTVLVERYSCLELFNSENPEVIYVTPTVDVNICIGSDIHFMEAAQSNEYNLMLFLRAVRVLGFKVVREPSVQYDLELPAKGVRVFGLSYPMKQWVKKVIFNISKWISKAKFGEKILVLNDSKLPFRYMWQLFKSRKFRLVLACRRDIAFNADRDKNVRSQLFDSLQKLTDFERFIAESISLDLPSVYLEDFQEVSRKSFNWFNLDADLVMSSTAWYYDDAFKFWAGIQAAKGSTLIGAQHGGNYGVSRYHLEIEHETRISQYYFTWGWSHGIFPSEIIRGGMLAKAAHRIKPSSLILSILFVATTKPNYFIDLRFSPWEAISYVQRQTQFVETINQRTLKKFLVRLYPGASQNNELASMWSNRNTKVTFDLKSSFTKLLEKASMVVTDHLSTTYAQALLSGVPTVIILDPDAPASVFTDEFKPILKKFVDANIVFTSPSEAAQWVNHLDSDTAFLRKWWESKQVQIAILAFSHFFRRLPRQYSFVDALYRCER